MLELGYGGEQMKKIVSVLLLGLLLCSCSKAAPLYEVSFVTLGGTSVASVKANETEPIELQPVSSKPNYAFAGWYEDVNYVTPAVFPYSPNQDVTLYAKWIVTLSSSDFSYVLKENGEYAVVSYSGNSINLVLPTEYEGVAVTGVANNAFSFTQSVYSVVIPEGYTAIGDWAFADCDDLNYVTLPDSLVSVGMYAFYDCDRMTDVIIKESVSLGENAFSSRSSPGCHCSHKYN